MEILDWLDAHGTPEAHIARDEIIALRRSVAFYKSRCDELYRWQSVNTAAKSRVAGSIPDGTEKTANTKEKHNMSKPLVIYHANCADGFGAAFAAWLVLGDEAEYKPCAYGDKDFTHPFDVRENVDGRDVYILDFSFPRPVMDQIFADAKHVVWLDHHASAFKEHGFAPNAPGEPAIKPLTKHTATLDNNKSGALLAWEYFHPGTEVPLLIRMIDDRDRWQFKIPGSRELNAAIWSLA